MANECVNTYVNIHGTALVFMWRLIWTGFSVTIFFSVLINPVLVLCPNCLPEKLGVNKK
jgi:hypothetical protein